METTGFPIVVGHDPPGWGQDPPVREPRAPITPRSDTDDFRFRIEKKNLGDPQTTPQAGVTTHQLGKPLAGRSDDTDVPFFFVSQSK